ncbi:tRNA 2'-O-methyltransferase Trm13 [Schizosaccharomyces japonicus yFS275]|uniref:tRNA:m(4)X modification enzyme TRM13 n=1 Tax=Schizosaccharomyces japonicus (strain yFS275 / FY16936) TaxID=402676 RepID=B6JXR4_SCHJY|nr:tRNA 2'-O-methyltransferase Trm13 [Schizosaccharomyces japonicus yFS275]EEB06332.1 tRNA 2'-O-methyltransferase Trm13 [Schizosaccharomyces japonicus yFS275]
MSTILDKQVQCPIDGRHTIAESHLQRHIKRCNTLPKPELLPYYKANVNAPSLNKTAQCSTTDKFELRQLSKDEIQTWVSKFKTLFSNLPIPKEEIYHHPAMDEREAECTNKKNPVQQASILGHMGQLGLFNNKPAVFLEFGAGRAELSRYVQRCSNQPNWYILIDRGSARLKHDSRIVKDMKERGFPEPSITRCKIDIKDFDLGYYLDRKPFEGPIHAYSKHLCGAATDLTLSCLNQWKTDTIFIALCCHHRCQWHLLNPTTMSILQEWGIDNPHAFQVLCQMTGWAINSLRPNITELGGADTHFSGMCHKDRTEIGLMCKHIINYARCLTLSRLGYNAWLVKYVSSNATLENVALIATRKEQ